MFMDWCNLWLVKINVSKTAVIYFYKTFSYLNRLNFKNTTSFQKI